MRPRQLSVVVTVLVCLRSSSVAKSSDQKEQTREPITLLKLNKGTKAGRPKAPDRQVITCAYDGYELFLTFVYPEGTATLSVTDETCLTTTYEIDTTPLEVVVPVGELFGSVTIEMDTEADKSYFGEIQ